MQQNTYKNIVYASITAGGNVHIGDNITYMVERDLQHSLLFLRMVQVQGEQYALNLHIKSRHHNTADAIATKGKPLLHEAVQVRIAPELFQNLADFQAFRRGNNDAAMRHPYLQTPAGIAAFEEALGRQIHQCFFAGDIGQVCADFIALLEARRIENLCLVIAADDERIINLPFEMVLPFLFPPKLGEARVRYCK